jgi:hypothetical protein
VAALESHYMTILKKVLEERFVPFLPPLLDQRKPAAEQKAKQLSRAFSAFALHKLLELSLQEATTAVVDDFQDRGIDAIYYHANSKTLYLLQTKLKESEQFKQDDALPFCEGVHLLLEQNFKSFNANVQNRQTEIENTLDVCDHIKLVVAYTGDGISKTATDALQAFLEQESLDEERLSREVQFYMPEDIARDLLAEKAHKPVNADIFLQNYQKIESRRKTYFGVASLADLVALHQKEGKALYECNIRYFLGSTKSEVNRSIKATLHDNQADFFHLNNGVTAICDQIEPKSKRNCIKKFEIRGLSIINGAQTVASAAEFVQEHPDKSIDDAKVLLTLIKVSAKDEFGKRITKARNQQNQVQIANFVSLDENQERLRQEIAHLGLIYTYRPETVTVGGGALFTFNDALRALALYQSDPRYAVWLKTESSRLESTDSIEYKTLFSTRLSGVSLINTIRCYRAIRDQINCYESGTERKTIERLIYRHSNNVIASVMIKRFRNRIKEAEVLKMEDLRTLISQPLDQLRQETFDLGMERLKSSAFEPLAYFRNLEYTVPFLIDLMKKNYGLEQFQTETNPERLHKLSKEDKSLEQDLAERLAKAAPQI